MATPKKRSSPPPSSFWRNGSEPSQESTPSAAGLKALVFFKLVGEEDGSIPKSFKNPVEVPTAVFDGLETVQKSGETSMVDHQAVQEIAARLGYPEAALWIREHENQYLDGIFRGFVVIKE